MRNDRTYLAHIRDAIETIAEYIQGVDYEQFSTNKMMIDAVVRELEIIGEASNNLTEEFRQKYPDMSWRRMKDMRNFLIHEYFGVNAKVVWETCQNDIQALRHFVETVLNE